MFTVPVAAIYLVERFLYSPLYGEKEQTIRTLVSSIAIMMIASTFFEYCAGSSTVKLSLKYDLVTESYGGMEGVLILNLILGFLVTMSIIWFTHSEYMLKIKALASSLRNSELMGLNVNRLRSMSFFIGTLVVTLVAFLILIDTGLNPRTGSNLLLKSFVIVVLNEKMRIDTALMVAALVECILHVLEAEVNVIFSSTLLFLCLLVTFQFRNLNHVNYSFRQEIEDE